MLVLVVIVLLLLFGMTPEHFDELSGLTQYTVTNARGEITSAILNSIAKLTKCVSCIKKLGQF